MSRTILIKPLITEKMSKLTESLNRYAFIVDRRSNKLEIAAEVEKMFSVSVDAVNTITLPGKNKTRYSKSGMIKGKTSPVKKAIITLKEGEVIDFYTGI